MFTFTLQHRYLIEKMKIYNKFIKKKRLCMSGAYRHWVYDLMGEGRGMVLGPHAHNTVCMGPCLPVSCNFVLVLHKYWLSGLWPLMKTKI
jgi:hypothetical protein